MKAIGYVLPSFPVLSETFVGTEMRAMERRGHRIVPIAFERHSGPAQSADDGLARRTHYLNNIHDVDVLDIAKYLKPQALAGLAFAIGQRSLPLRSLLWQSAKLATVAKRNNCHHLHAHFALSTAATAIVAARLTGLSVSFVGHGFDVYTSPKDLDRKLKHADFTVAVCEDMASMFRQLAPKARIELVHCGIETARFSAPEKDRMQQPALLFIGRLVEKKGCDLLLHALAGIPRSERPALDIVGEGPLQQTLQDLCVTLDLTDKVRFLGSKSAEWIASEGPSYLALVAPFREAANGDRDTGPIVAKEAMAMGIPVIASSFMGLREIVEDHVTGMLVPTNDGEALARAIREMVHLQPAQRTSMGVCARQRVAEKFDADVQAAYLSRHVEAA